MVAELAPNAIYVAGDCADPAQAKTIANAAIDNFGTIDAVVPNAGIGFYGSILDHSDEDVNRMMRTNYEGTVHMIRAALPVMLEKGEGDVIIVASVAGFRGGDNEAIYTGTKHAQVGFAGALDRELRAKGVRVALVCPAGVETEFALGFGRSAGEDKLKTYLRPQDVAFQITTIMSQPRSVRTHIWTLWSMQQDS
jgi:3-oxoacyl-[acyl-carrier protein] reductase